MKTIFKKELRGYFTSPMAYVFMACMLFMFGLYFVMLNVFGQNADYSYVINSLTTVLMFLIPILTMRLLSEEKKNRTDQLLLTLPIRVRDIVLGKFLAAVALLGITLTLTMIHPLILSFMGVIPVAKIVGAYVGYFLLGTTLIAIGLFVSGLSENQIVSAIATEGIFLFFLLVDNIAAVIPKQRVYSIGFLVMVVLGIGVWVYQAVKNKWISLGVVGVGLAGVACVGWMNSALLDGLPTKIFQWFSIFRRYDGFARGILDVSAVVYYLSFVLFFVFLTIQTIEKRSWS